MSVTFNVITTDRNHNRWVSLNNTVYGITLDNQVINGDGILLQPEASEALMLEMLEAPKAKMVPTENVILGDHLAFQINGVWKYAIVEAVSYKRDTIRFELKYSDGYVEDMFKEKLLSYELFREIWEDEDRRNSPVSEEAKRIMKKAFR
jgi:hypothetical protein